MEKTTDKPECAFCHSTDLELFYSKLVGLIVQCEECGYAKIATNEHLASDQVKLLAG